MLGKIINRNAQIAIERASKRAVENGERPVTKSEVARRMARRLHPDIQEFAQPEEFLRQWKSLKRTLTALDREEQRWNADHIQAFCESLGIVPERLLAEDYDAAKVSEASYAAFLTKALGRRLAPAEARRIIQNLTRELEQPGMFDLVSSIAEQLLEAKDRGQALEAATSAILKSNVWDGPRNVAAKRKPKAGKR